MMRIMQATHRAVRLASVAIALAVSSQAAHAQQPSPVALGTAKEIVAVTGATTLFDPMIAGVVGQTRLLFLQQDPGLSKDLNDISARMIKDLTPRFDELVNEVTRIYATHYTEQELKDLLAFYKSPAGKKLIVEQPKIVDASLKFAQNWANGLSDEVFAKMREELKKKGHAL